MLGNKSCGHENTDLHTTSTDWSKSLLLTSSTMCSMNPSICCYLYQILFKYLVLHIFSCLCSFVTFPALHTETFLTWRQRCVCVCFMHPHFQTFFYWGTLYIINHQCFILRCWLTSISSDTQTKISHPLYQGRVMVFFLSTRSMVLEVTSNIRANIFRNYTIFVVDTVCKDYYWLFFHGRKFVISFYNNE